MGRFGLPAVVHSPLLCDEHFNVLGFNLSKAHTCPFGGTFIISLFKRVGNLSKSRAAEEGRQRLSPGWLTECALNHHSMLLKPLPITVTIVVFFLPGGCKLGQELS